ncbi:hypothetical protein FPK32_25885, partial [Acinetobacter baumannii]|nr:hypothetical protein [Acinetobacter baumannii]
RGFLLSNFSFSKNFSSIKDARETYWYSEIVPEQTRIANTINEWAGETLVQFKNYDEMKS